MWWLIDLVCSMQEWLHHLYRAVYPIIHFHGSAADLNLSYIRDSSECIEVVQKWIHERVKWITPGDNPQEYLAEVLRLTRLASAFSCQLPLIDYVSRHRVPYGERQRSQDNAARDIIISLDGSNRNAVSCGVSVLR